MVDLTDIGCCNCFSILRKSSVHVRQPQDADGMLSENLLNHQSAEDLDGSFYTGDDPDLSFYNGDDIDRSFFSGDDPDRSFFSGDDPDGSFYDRDGNDYHDGSDDGPPRKTSEDIIHSRAQNGLACREIPVKETNKVFRSEVLNKACMMKVHVVRSETAMTDVLREDDDDMLWRSPGTPVFTAPECFQGSAYHGRASDMWAVGVTLYCMISGHYPFLGDTLQETYDKIANDPVQQIPGDMNSQLADLLQRLLCKCSICFFKKIMYPPDDFDIWDFWCQMCSAFFVCLRGYFADPVERITLQDAAEHPWVVGDKGPVPEYICRCGFGRRKRNDSQE